MAADHHNSSFGRDGNLASGSTIPEHSTTLLNQPGQRNELDHTPDTIPTLYGLRSWYKVDTRGVGTVVNLEMHLVKSDSGLAVGDMRLLCPRHWLEHPISDSWKILFREKAIILSFDRARALITSDHILLAVDPTNEWCFDTLKEKLSGHAATAYEHMPFKFAGLAVCLEVAYSYLKIEERSLTLTDPEISTLDSNQVNEKRRRLEALDTQVQQVIYQLDQVLNDDELMITSFLPQTIQLGVLVERLFKGMKESSSRISKSVHLLDGRQEDLDKIEARRQEDLEQIEAKKVRWLSNAQLIMTIASLVISLFTMITGVFGMNFRLPWFQKRQTLKFALVTLGNAFGCLVLFLAALVYFYRKGMLHY